MNVLFLSPTVDTAGQGIALKRAFDAYGGEWHARHVRCSDSWLHYPGDVTWDRDDAVQSGFVAELWRQADVLVIIEQPLAASWGPRKPTVVWHLGSWFRRAIPVVHEQCRAIGALEVADMADLIVRAGYPMDWLPDVLDPAPLAALRTGRRDVLRVGHAPTDRAIKRTDLILRAVENLVEQGHAFEFDCIEGVPNAECLARKARCDVFVDDMGGLGIGLNALECFAMGIPVVSHVADPAVKARMTADYGGNLPFAEVAPDRLEATLLALLEEPLVREAVAEGGREGFARYHSPQAVVERWVATFERMAVAA